MTDILSKNIDTADRKVAYDENAKHLLANKEVLARIIGRVVHEFEGMTPSEIIPYIEGEIEVGTKRIEPGMTNNPKIIGITQEDHVPNEGRIVYDIYFYLRTPLNEKIRIYVNIEMQKEWYPDERLIRRGIFYGARGLSSQGDRDFSLSRQEYNRLSKVYSIWICMNVPEAASNTISSIAFQQRSLYGQKYRMSETYDLIEVVFIRLGKTWEESDDLISFLVTLLTDSLAANEKKRLLTERYNMNFNEDVEKRIDTMCNLSEGIYQRGIAVGKAEGKIEGKAEGKIEGIAEGKAEGKAEEQLKNRRENTERAVQLITSGKLTVSEAAGLFSFTEEDLRKALGF